MVGYDSLTFIDDLKAQNHVLAHWNTVAGNAACEVDVSFAPSSAHALNTLGPYVCRKVTR